MSHKLSVKFNQFIIVPLWSFTLVILLILPFLETLSIIVHIHFPSTTYRFYSVENGHNSSSLSPLLHFDTLTLKRGAKSESTKDTSDRSSEPARKTQEIGSHVSCSQEVDPGVTG